jgi:hypothetical protein
MEQEYYFPDVFGERLTCKCGAPPITREKRYRDCRENDLDEKQVVETRWTRQVWRKKNERLGWRGVSGVTMI